MLEFLQGTKLLTAVQDDMGWASSKGIEGVPFFIVNDKRAPRSFVRWGADSGQVWHLGWAGKLQVDGILRAARRGLIGRVRAGGDVLRAEMTGRRWCGSVS
jgi:hypothetical protein